MPKEQGPKNQKETVIDLEFSGLVQQLYNGELSLGNFRWRVKAILESLEPTEAKLKKSIIFDALKVARDRGRINEKEFQDIAKELLEFKFDAQKEKYKQ